MAANAPAIPTQAYTRLLTKRVAGLVMEEKNVALSPHTLRRSLISSNCACASFSWPNAKTTFWLPSISSTREVSSPLVCDCFRNMVYVLLAMKLATNSETGVTRITTTAMAGLIVNMNISVPKIVRTPVNSWVKPMRSPSENWSMSAIRRLMISPWEWESMYFNGRLSIFANARTRISFTTRYVIVLLIWLISHWATAVTAIITPIFKRILLISAKSTFPGARIQSIALPVKIGT